MSGFFDELEGQLRDAAASVHRARCRRRRWLVGLGVAAGLGVATPVIAATTGVWDPGLGPEPVGRTANSGTMNRISDACTPPNRQLPLDLSQSAPDPRLAEALEVLKNGPPVTPEIALQQARRTSTLVEFRGVYLRFVRVLGRSPSGRPFYIVAGRELRTGPRLPIRCYPKSIRARERYRRTHPNPGVCISNAGGTCANLRDLLRRGIPGATGGASGTNSQFLYLVPDDVSKVRFSYPNGQARTYPVRNNLVQFLIKASPMLAIGATFTWLDDEGRTIKVVRPLS